MLHVTCYACATFSLKLYAIWDHTLTAFWWQAWSEVMCPDAWQRNDDIWMARCARFRALNLPGTRCYQGKLRKKFRVYEIERAGVQILAAFVAFSSGDLGRGDGWQREGSRDICRARVILLTTTLAVAFTLKGAVAVAELGGHPLRQDRRNVVQGVYSFHCLLPNPLHLSKLDAWIKIKYE